MPGAKVSLHARGERAQSWPGIQLGPWWGAGIEGSRLRERLALPKSQSEESGPALPSRPLAAGSSLDWGGAVT